MLLFWWLFFIYHVYQPHACAALHKSKQCLNSQRAAPDGCFPSIIKFHPSLLKLPLPVNVSASVGSGNTKEQCNLDYNYEGYFSCSNHAITTLIDIVQHSYNINYYSIMLCYHLLGFNVLNMLTHLNCTILVLTALAAHSIVVFYTLQYSTICAIHFTAYIDICAHFN